MSNHDLQVDHISNALAGKRIDVIVSGSIGAIEAPRLMRALRRLGAEVFPILTDGGAQFVTPMACAWGAGREVTAAFSGSASHIAQHDACVIAPASANFIERVLQGRCNDAASTLAASYLGLNDKNRPLLFVPNMHGSMADSPFIAENIQRLSAVATCLQSRQEEGKWKFPEPKVLAGDIAQAINRPRWAHLKSPILVTMGSTRAPIDAVRYVANTSTGGLGTILSEELYRRGFPLNVISGPSAFAPMIGQQLQQVSSAKQMQDAVAATLDRGVSAAVFAAAVLDFVPKDPSTGKFSSDSDTLTVTMTKAPKIIALAKGKVRPLIAFKLEATWPENPQKIAEDYMSRYDLTMVIVNAMQTIGATSPTQHEAMIFERSARGEVTHQRAATKMEIAERICQHLESHLLSS